MPMGIVVISCVRPSVQPSMGLGLCIAYKALGRNVSRWLTLSIHGCLWILLLVCLSVHMSVCSFTAFSGSHYWEMAVAITCGYGGYLLPLLAAHSSLSVLTRKVRVFFELIGKHMPFSWLFLKFWWKSIWWKMSSHNLIAFRMFLVIQGDNLCLYFFQSDHLRHHLIVLTFGIPYNYFFQ